MAQVDKTLRMAQFSILLAIEALFCFTPLGSLPAIGPIVMTLAMIPVIITGIMLGPAYGTFMGLCAGIFSLIVWTFMPPNPLVAFAFSPAHTPGNFFSVVICLVPRALAGLIAGLANRRMAKAKDILRYSVAGILGSMTNTLLVMGGIVVFFGNIYAETLGVALFALVSTTILTSGIPEAILAAIAATAVCRPLTKLLGRNGATKVKKEE